MERIIFWVLTVLHPIVWDFIDDNKIINNHFPRWFARVFIAFGITFFWYDNLEPVTQDINNLPEFIHWLGLMFLEGAIFWIIFNPMQNRSRGQQWLFYVGNTSKIDKFFRKIGGNHGWLLVIMSQVLMLGFAILLMLLGRSG